MLKELEIPKSDTYKLLALTIIAYYHELTICSRSGDGGGGGGNSSSNYGPYTICL